MTRFMTAFAAVAFLAVLPATAQAGANCSQKISNLNIGNKSIPLAGKVYGKDVSLTNEDCVQQNLDRALDRHMALAATQDQVLTEPGLNVSLKGALGDVDPNNGAGGLNLNYVMTPEWAEKFLIGVGGGTTFEGDDQIVSLTIGFSFGTLFPAE